MSIDFKKLNPLKKKEKQEDDFSNYEFFDLEEESDSSEENLGFLKRNKKKLILLVVCVVVLTPVYFIQKNQEQQQQKIVEQQQEEVSEQLSEIHTNLGYYLMNGAIDQKLEATGQLVAHIFDTGCSDAYLQLMKAYDNNSLSYLQDYLRGHTCNEYFKSNSVLLVKYPDVCNYLIITDRREDKYILSIKYSQEMNTVSSFSLRPYEEQDIINGTNEPEQTGSVATEVQNETTTESKNNQVTSEATEESSTSNTEDSSESSSETTTFQDSFEKGRVVIKNKESNSQESTSVVTTSETTTGTETTTAVETTTVAPVTN